MLLHVLRICGALARLRPLPARLVQVGYRCRRHEEWQEPHVDGRAVNSGAVNGEFAHETGAVTKGIAGSFDPKTIKVLKRGPSGRAIVLKIVEKNGSELLLRFDDIRRVFRQLPSTLFVVNEVKEGQWLFLGGGFGHGVGMPQSGAIELARNGWNTEQILSHYYPKTKYEFLP